MNDMQKKPDTSTTQPVVTDLQKSGMPLLSVLGMVVVASMVAGSIGLYVGSRQKTEPEVDVVSLEPPVSITTAPDLETTGCTLEAKICSDGTAVGRSGPNCEFEACPPTQSEDGVVVLEFVVPKSQKLSPTEPRVVSFSPTMADKHMSINGTTFTIDIVPAGNGLCPWEEIENYWCTKIEETFPHSLGLNIWKDSKRGVFALNTMRLVIQDYETDVIIVSKQDKKGFSDAEVQLWKEMLQSIRLAT